MDFALAFFLICSALAVSMIAAGMSMFLFACALERRELAALHSACRRAAERCKPSIAEDVEKWLNKAGNGIAASVASGGSIH